MSNSPTAEPNSCSRDCWSRLYNDGSFSIRQINVVIVVLLVSVPLAKHALRQGELQDLEQQTDAMMMITDSVASIPGVNLVPVSLSSASR